MWFCVIMSYIESKFRRNVENGDSFGSGVFGEDFVELDLKMNRIWIGGWKIFRMEKYMRIVWNFGMRIFV